MRRFDNLPDEMSSEEYLQTMRKRRFKGQKRVQSTHCWLDRVNPVFIYTDKSNAQSQVDESNLQHFHSLSEAKRYVELFSYQLSGLITDLIIAPKLLLVKIGEQGFYWKADYQYKRNDGVTIIEDVKSYRKRKQEWYVPNGKTYLQLQLMQARIDAGFLGATELWLYDSSSSHAELYRDATIRRS